MSVTPNDCASISDFNNPACISIMSDYCSTDEPLGETYTEKWEGDTFTSKCRRYVELNLGNQIQYVPVIDSYVRRYLLTEANDITFPQQGSLIFDPAIEDVIDVCYTPGGCDAVLDQKCASFARDDLKINPNLGKLCGCFMSDLEYDKYQGAFGVQKICDPACTLQSAVKPRNPANQFETLECGQTICVIDDVKIELLNNTTVGDINFGQACGNCDAGTGGCQCFISDISITATESVIQDVNFDQNCGGNPFCYQTDSQGVPQQVDCSVLEPDTGNGGNSPPSGISTTTILIIIGIITAVIIILIVIIVLTSRNKNENFVYGNRSRYPSYSAI